MSKKILSIDDLKMAHTVVIRTLKPFTTEGLKGNIELRPV